MLVAAYLTLNAIVVAVGLAQVATHPEVFSAWTRLLTTEHPIRLAVVGVAVLVFPKLALALSGSETGVAVMPQIIRDPTDTREEAPGTLRGVHHLLATAALIMSVALILPGHDGVDPARGVSAPVVRPTAAPSPTSLTNASGMPSARRGPERGETSLRNLYAGDLT